MYANIKTGECSWEPIEETVLSINEQGLKSFNFKISTF